MAGFILDTSGFVYSTTFPPDTGSPTPHGIFWPDLSPFEHGYVGAMFRDHEAWRGWAVEKIAERCEEMGEEPHGDIEAYLLGRGLGFSDLAPATLAAIRKDCAALRGAGSDTTERGRQHWLTRQTGGSTPGFPPLTVTLGDDGLVYLRGAGQ